MSHNIAVMFIPIFILILRFPFLWNTKYNDTRYFVAVVLLFVFKKIDRSRF